MYLMLLIIAIVCFTVLCFILLFIYSNIILRSYFSILISGAYYSPPCLDEIIVAVGLHDYLQNYWNSVEYFGDYGRR